MRKWKQSIKIILHRMLAWTVDWRAILAFLLGAVLCIDPVVRYLDFAEVIGSRVNYLEAFIYIGSSEMAFSRWLLGALLLVSDAPFVKKGSQYEVLRTGRHCWLAANIGYIFLAVLVYMLFILAVTIVLSAAIGSVSFENEWSAAMRMLAEKQPGFAALTYDLSFPYPMFIRDFRPGGALGMTILYNGAYVLLLAMILYITNLLADINIGWLAAAAVHIIGYVIYANGIYVFPAKFSLFECAMPAVHCAEAYEIGSLYAAAVLIIPSALLGGLSWRRECADRILQKL